jgi:hypothetical protein
LNIKTDPAVEPDRLELFGVERRHSCPSCKRPLRFA